MGTSGARKISDGTYIVRFERDVRGCAYVATDTGVPFTNTLQAFPGDVAGGVADEVAVKVFSGIVPGPDGLFSPGLIDGAFDLVVACTP